MNGIDYVDVAGVSIVVAVVNASVKEEGTNGKRINDVDVHMCECSGRSGQ